MNKYHKLVFVTELYVIIQILIKISHSLLREPTNFWVSLQISSLQHSIGLCKIVNFCNISLLPHFILQKYLPSWYELYRLT